MSFFFFWLIEPQPMKYLQRTRRGGGQGIRSLFLNSASQKSWYSAAAGLGMHEIPPLRPSPITATGVYPWIGPDSHSMPPPPNTLQISRNCCARLLSKRGRDSATQLRGNCHSHASLAPASPADEEKCVRCRDACRRRHLSRGSGGGVRPLRRVLRASGSPSEPVEGKVSL